MKCDMCYTVPPLGGRRGATGRPHPGARLRTPETLARESAGAHHVFWFGNEKVTTKVFYMVPPGAAEVRVDVVDFIWEEA